MKKYIIVITALVAFATACSTKTEIESPVIDNGKQFDGIINATLEECRTKTQLGGSNYSLVEWEANDQIKAFGVNGIYTSTAITPNGSSAQFTLPAEANEDVICYAAYPASLVSGTVGESIINVTIPSTQTAKSGGFAQNTNVAAGVVIGSSVSMKNVGSLLSVRVTNTNIKSVTLSAVSASKNSLCGNGTVSFTSSNDINVTSPQNLVSEVTLSAGDGTFENDKYYFFVVYPGKYEKLVLTFKNSEDKYARISRTSNNGFTFSKNDNYTIFDGTIPNSAFKAGFAASNTVSFTYDFTQKNSYPTGFPTSNTATASRQSFTFSGNNLILNAPTSYYEINSNVDASRGLFFGKTATSNYKPTNTSAYIEFPAIANFKLQSVVATSTNGIGGSIKLNIYDTSWNTKSSELSTATSTEQDYEFSLSSSSNDTAYRLASGTSSKNLQFRKITLTYLLGSSIPAVGTSSGDSGSGDSGSGSGSTSYSAKTVWQDDFSTVVMTNSSAAISSLSGSYSGFTGAYTALTKVNTMSGALKLGTTSASGTITTPVLSLIEGTRSLTITLIAEGWNGKSATLTLTANGAGTVTESATSIVSQSSMAGTTPSISGNQSYTFHVTNATSQTSITITSNLSVGIDDLLIIADAKQ